MFSSANTGILHEDLPMLEFVPGTSVLTTKRNDLIVVFRAGGIDPECLTDEAIEKKCERFLEATQFFGDEYRLTQTLISSPAPPVTLETDYPNKTVLDLARRSAAHFAPKRLFHQDLYFSILLKAPLAKSFAASFNMKELAKKLAGTETERAHLLLSRSETFEKQLRSTSLLELLDREGVKGFYTQLVRFRPYNRAQRVPRDRDLDYWTPNSRPGIYADHVWHDGHYLKAVTMRDTPRLEGEILDGDRPRKVYGTHAAVFSGLLAVDCGFIATLDWNPQNPLYTKGKVSALQKSFDNKVVSLMSRLFANKNDSRADMRQDTSAVKNRDELGQALVALDSGNFFGELSCSVILYDEELRQVRDAVPKVFGALKGATAMEEDQGTYDAWMAAIPGNYHKNERALLCPVRAYKDMSFLWKDDTGVTECRVTPDRKPLFHLLTKQNGLYGYEPNDKSVVGVMIYGQQGGGKTFLANKHLDHYQRLAVKIGHEWVRPITFVMDVKDSYKRNTLRHGGVYRALSLDNPGGFRRNPYALPVSKDNIERITRLVQLMLTADNGAPLNPEQIERIRQEVRDKYIQKERGGLRLARLGHMNLGRDLQERFKPWIHDGPYAAFFDNDSDQFEDAAWLSCQYSGFNKHKSVLLPLLYWDFEWFDSKVNDPRLTRVPKLFLADELHVLLLASPVIGPYVLEKINTGRSFNLWNIFVMQWANLLEQHEIGATLNAACPVKLFTASENVRAADYAKIFEMPLKVAEMIKTLQPRQVLRYSASGAKVLTVDVDPQSIEYYSNDVESNARRYEEEAQALAAIA